MHIYSITKSGTQEVLMSKVVGMFRLFLNFCFFLGFFELLYP